MERSMRRSFVAAAGLGIFVLVAAVSTSTEAQSKPEPEIASIPPKSAFASLSAGNKRIATALFEAQTTPNGATPVTLGGIAPGDPSRPQGGHPFPAPDAPEP